PTSFSLCSHYTAPPALSTLPLHDALPISPRPMPGCTLRGRDPRRLSPLRHRQPSWSVVHSCGSPLLARVRLRGWDPEAALVRIRDRKSTRLNSSHVKISYAVFCLKKKKRK